MWLDMDKQIGMYAGKCQGRTDIELNETGIEQAKQAKEQLKNYNIDQIICSPLKRTRKTAEIINETTNWFNYNWWKNNWKRMWSNWRNYQKWMEWYSKKWYKYYK